MKKCTKKIASLILTAGMLLSAIPSSFISSSVVIAAETEADTEEVHIWDGTSDIS